MSQTEGEESQVQPDVSAEKVRQGAGAGASQPVSAVTTVKKSKEPVSEAEEPDMPRVYLLPNLMTAGNLFCGFLATLQIIQGMTLREDGVDGWTEHYTLALYAIIGAFVFDFLDGRVARFGGHESPFGREFDSLADIVSFGIAPAMLVHTIVLQEFHRIGWLIGFLYLLCGALRLARFNCIAAASGGGGGKEFTGFPIPAAAAVIASITLFLLNMYEHERELGNFKYLLAVLMVFLSFMMFSKVKYPSFKTINWRTRRSLQNLVLIIAMLGLVVLYPPYILPLIFLGYLLYGFLRPLISRRMQREIEQDEDEEHADRGPTL